MVIVLNDFIDFGLELVFTTAKFLDQRIIIYLLFFLLFRCLLEELLLIEPTSAITKENFQQRLL